MKILSISRPTIYNYRMQGKLKAVKLPNGHYNYDENSIYSLNNGKIKRKTYLYTRVSTSKQQKDLLNQLELLKTWCFNKGY